MKNNIIMIGTSGFSYKDWLGNFYPQFCPQADFLQFYASKFKTVEIDSTYYRMPNIETVNKWKKITPDAFVFTAKFPKTVTHEGELENRIENAHRFIDVMKNLNTKLGALLLQFPYSFKPDKKKLLFELLRSLPKDIRFAVELRNKSWLEVDELFKLLKDKNIAFCLIDHPLMPRLDIQTADFTYVRFLGDRKKIENDFSFVRFDRQNELEFWHDLLLKIKDQGKPCFGYFNNHYSGHAPTTALNLLNMLNSKE